MSEIERIVTTLEEATAKYREAEESLNYCFSLLAQKVYNLSGGGLPIHFYGVGALGDALREAYAKCPLPQPRITVNLPSNMTHTLVGAEAEEFIIDHNLQDAEPGSDTTDGPAGG